MTITVKFPTALEAELRRHAEAQGLATSLVVREAVAQYLVRAQAAATPTSAAALGDDLFGRHSGPADLATRRKAALAEAWVDKHAVAAATGLPTSQTTSQTTGQTTSQTTGPAAAQRRRRGNA